MSESRITINGTAHLNDGPPRDAEIEIVQDWVDTGAGPFQDLIRGGYNWSLVIAGPLSLGETYDVRFVAEGRTLNGRAQCVAAGELVAAGDLEGYWDAIRDIPARDRGGQQ